MEIRRWLYYVIFNCFLIQYLDAKTFSLNDVIAAESQHKDKSETKLHPKSTANGEKRGRLTKRLTSLSRVKKLRASNFAQERAYPVDKILSPLKQRKSYQIKNPLKPKKFKIIQKSRYKRKNQSTKRDFKYDGKRKQNDIPLLKSLSLLFDNFLNTDASESVEFKTKKYKRNRFYSEDFFEVPFRTDKSDYRYPDSQPKEKTVVTSSTPATEISFAAKDRPSAATTSTPTNYITPRDFSTFRQNTDIPILLPRNTSSSRRNYHGDSEGSSTTLYRDYKGHLSGDYGDHEHTTRIGKETSDAEDDTKDTDSNSRNGTRGFRSPGRNGNTNNTGILSRGNGTNERDSENTTTDDYIGQDQLEDRRNETKGSGVLQEPIRGIRGFSEDDNQIAEFVRPKEIRKESIVNVTDNNTSNKRITDRSSPVAAENQETRKGNETIIVEIKANSTISSSKTASKNVPMVMIFDGYSITRHKNGENKFSEKSIRIRA